MNIVLDVLRYLNEHDITLVKAAEATGVAQQNIKKSIGNNPKTSTLLALASGLGVDPREFFYDLDEKEKKNTTQTDPVVPSSLVTYDTTEEKKEKREKNTQKDARPTINTIAFCPHCGARVHVGVVLMPEQ